MDPGGAADVRRTRAGGMDRGAPARRRVVPGSPRAGGAGAGPGAGPGGGGGTQRGPRGRVAARSGGRRSPAGLAAGGSLLPGPAPPGGNERGRSVLEGGDGGRP